jgi:hypothetical protein
MKKIHPPKPASELLRFEVDDVVVDATVHTEPTKRQLLIKLVREMKKQTKALERIAAALERR